MAAAAALPAPDAAPAPAKKKPSLVIQGALFLVTTLMAVGTGWLGGGYVKPPAPPSAEAGAPVVQATVAPTAADAKAEGKDPPAPAPGQPVIVPLAPITTNLAAPADTWLRLELAVEFSEPPAPGLADTVTEDFLGYLHTVKLHQISGPSGLLHLKEDLDERAKIRTEGKATAVFVRALIFE